MHDLHFHFGISIFFFPFLCVHLEKAFISTPTTKHPFKKRNESKRKTNTISTSQRQKHNPNCLTEIRFSKPPFFSIWTRLLDACFIQSFASSTCIAYSGFSFFFLHGMCLGSIFSFLVILFFSIKEGFSSPIFHGYCMERPAYDSNTTTTLTRCNHRGPSLVFSFSPLSWTTAYDSFFSFIT